MTVGRDVADAVRLAATEWWLPVELAAGVVGYVVWVAGTGAVLTSVAESAGVPVGPDGGAGTLVAVAVLWLALPAALAAWRLRARLTNIRGNLEGAYRFDRPAALLVPPLALVGALAAAGAALGFPTAVLVALAPAALYLLVRTVAYSYRVYTLSYPSVLVGLAAVAIAAQALAVLVAVGPLVGRAGVVDAALSTAGVASALSGTVGTRGVAVPAWLAIGVAAPLAVPVGYLLCQALASAGARVLEPAGSKRADQRYPPWLDATAAGRSRARPTGGGASDSTAAADDDAESSPDAEEAGASDGEDAAEQDLDDVSHTKVFTPPAGDGGGPDADDAGGDPDGRQQSADDQRCDSCGERFDVAADLAHCPACGEALE